MIRDDRDDIIDALEAEKSRAHANWLGIEERERTIEILRSDLADMQRQRDMATGLLDGAIALGAERTRERDDSDAALRRIEDWANAYPLDVFPEPDMKRVAEVLKAAGLTIDAVSASNMRHVITGVLGIASRQSAKGNR